MMQMKFRMAAAIYLVALVGCSGGGNEVNGKVTLDGQPLGQARVSFEPVDPADKLNAAAVTTTDSGEFVIEPHPGTGETLKAGKYVVTISRKTDQQGNVPPLEDHGQLEAAGMLKETVPAKYSAPNLQSELREEIKPGKNELKIDLQGA